MYTSIPVYTVSVPLIAGQVFRPQIGNDVKSIKINQSSIYQKPLVKFQGKITLLLLLGIHLRTSVDVQGIIGDCHMDNEFRTQ